MLKPISVIVTHLFIKIMLRLNCTTVSLVLIENKIGGKMPIPAGGDLVWCRVYCGASYSPENMVN